MPARFNPIACTERLDDGHLEAAGETIGLVLVDALQCAHCGRSYTVLLPQILSDEQKRKSTTDLQRAINRSCGRHLEILQTDSLD